MTRVVVPGITISDVAEPVPDSGVVAFLGRLDQVEPGWTRPGALPRGTRMGDAVDGFFACGGDRCWLAGLPSSDLDDLAAALDRLPDEVDLVVLPDLPHDDDHAAVIGAQRVLLRHCATRRDRFAILDAVPTPGAVAAQRAALAGPDGGYGALYHPWVVPAADPSRPVPPSGHVAGVYVRGDRRAGSRPAPANATLAGVVDLAEPISDAEFAELYDSGVNGLRVRPGAGIRIWGARTLTDPDDRSQLDVGTRRTVIRIGRWVDRFLSAVVYEPNDPRLWSRIVREVTGYLESLLTLGALRGASAAEAFSVKCDRELNPPESVGTGVVTVLVGVALRRPAEFVHLRIQHGAAGATGTAT